MATLAVHMFDGETAFLCEGPGHNLPAHTNGTHDWKKVTCKKCLKKRKD